MRAGLYFILAIIQLLKPYTVAGQGFVYVNTANLILRDRPDCEYMVFAILQAPFRLKVEKQGADYSKAVKDRFYCVSYTYHDPYGIGHYTRGWVEKKYTVAHLSAIATKQVDTNSSPPPQEIRLISYMGADEDDPNDWNYRQFPYPKYKGGEKQFPKPASTSRAYHLGARGGCYYLSKTGRKVYVDSKFCKEAEKKRKKPAIRK